MAGHAQAQFQNTIDILTITQKQRHSKTVLHNQRDHEKRVRNSAKRPESFGTFFHLPRSAKPRPFRQDLEYLRKSAIFARQRHYTPQHSKASYVFGKRYPPLLSAAAQRAETGLRSGCHRGNLSTGMGRHLPHGGRSGRMRGDRRRHGASARRAAAAA